MSEQGAAGGPEMPQPRVAIVDDEPEIARMVARVARNVGFAATIAESGRDLVELVERERPDVIVIDLVMPDMEGNEILIALRLAGPLPKVIVMTGYDETFLGPPTRLAGNALIGILHKPFGMTELAALLRRAIGRE
jgi:two-component system OmpR family response regulator